MHTHTAPAHTEQQPSPSTDLLLRAVLLRQLLQALLQHLQPGLLVPVAQCVTQGVAARRRSVEERGAYRMVAAALMSLGTASCVATIASLSRRRENWWE